MFNYLHDFFDLRGIATTLAAGLIMATVMTSIPPVKRVPLRILRYIFGPDLRARIIGVTIIIVIDGAVLLWNWDWRRPATVGDVAAISSLVMALWYLFCKLDALLEQLLDEGGPD